jgi:DNA-binding transcriptional LysR family regulator
MDETRESLPNLRQLEQFVAVAEELHFGRAAQRLHMQQAPLSQAIQKLEVALGIQLFERTHRSVTLTPAGAALLDEARGLVRRGREFTGLARGLRQGELGRLTVGFVSTAMYGDLPGVVRAFGERHPGVDLQLRETTSDVQVRQLESGDIDIGLLLGELPRGMNAIRSRVVRTETLIVALPTSWDANRFATGESNGAVLEVLQDESLVTIPRRVGASLYDAILACFRDRGLRPRFGQEAIQMQTILGLTAAGLGYAIVPASMRLLARPDIRFLDIAGGAPEIELRVAWRLGDPSPLTHDFVRLATAESPNRVASSA